MSVFFLVIIIALAVYSSYKLNTNTKEQQNKGTKEFNYQSNTKLSKNRELYHEALEVHRCRSIIELSRSCGLPVQIIYRDILNLKKDGFLGNVSVQYNQDKITYLDELSGSREPKVHEANSMSRQSIPNVSKPQTSNRETNSTRMAEARTKSNDWSLKEQAKSQSVNVSSKVEGMESHMAEGTSENQENYQADYDSLKTHAEYRADYGKGESLPEYQADYGSIEAFPEYHADYGENEPVYNYVAEYPDTSHIWDDFEEDLHLEQIVENVKTCPHCGTFNLMIKDTTGSSTCYMCHEQLV